VPRQTGLTAKNRERLRVLQDDRRLRMLLELPDLVWSSSKKSDKPYTEALRRETALAILIMMYCPIRSQNLADIHIERNLKRPGGGQVFLAFSPDEVKNSQPIEFELKKHVVRLIDRHLATRAPTLCPPATPWLFPRRDGTGPVSSAVIASRISKMVRKETGLQANAHLFRHLAVMLLLDSKPGSYETAKRLLGHTSASHTISVYSGMETTRVTQIFAEIVEQKRGKRK
jgi:integrase